MRDMAGSYEIMTGSLVCGENETPIEWLGFPVIFVHPPFLLRSKLSKHLSTSSTYHGPSPAFLTNFSSKILEGLIRKHSSEGPALTKDSVPPL